MTLNKVMLSKRSQTSKTIYRLIPFIGCSRRGRGSYDNRNQISGGLGCLGGWWVVVKEEDHSGTFQGGGDMYTLSSNCIHFNPVHLIVCKLYSN